MNLSVSEKSGSALAARLARWSLRHARWVIGGWILLAMCGALAAATVSSRLSFSFDLPGQPAYETNTAIVHTFGTGGNNPPLLAVAQMPPGRSVLGGQARTDLATLVQRVHTALPGARVASSLDSADASAFVSRDERTTFVMIYPVPDFTGSDPYDKALPALTAALSDVRIDGAAVHVTGASVLAQGGAGGNNSVLAETIVAALAALAVLAIVFGSLVALLPLLIALIAIPTAFAGIYLLTYATTVSTLVQNIVALIGLGVAIDYALLVVTRWREERAEGSDNRQAVLTAAGTAGSSVLFSGLTVTVSLAALALTTVPFLRSIGLAGLLIPLLSVAVSTTLLPVVLDRAGPRLEWPRKRPPRTVSRLWTGIARRVVAHRALAAGASALLLGALIAPVLFLQLGQPTAAAEATAAPAQARSALATLQEAGFGAGPLRPTEVLMPASAPLPAFATGISRAAPAAWQHAGQRVVDAWSPADASSSAGRSALDAIRRGAAAVPGAQIGGSPAQDDDFIHALYGRNLVIIIAAIVIVTVLLLSRALRSLWLPVKALLLNAMSLAASLGVLTLVWQQGHGSEALFGSPATGAITLWVPLAVFALLFGLSMDYEVFILSRINEEYAAGHGTDEAVVRGIARTGRLVSSGALILFFAFVALGGVPQTDVKILATGLASGIIIDATLIRGVLAPALVALLQRVNWWLPAPLARILRITPVRPSSTTKFARGRAS